MTWISINRLIGFLGRIGGGLLVWQIASSGVVLAALIAVKFVRLSRVFCTSLLSAEQIPNITAIWHLMFGHPNSSPLPPSPTPRRRPSTKDHRC